MASSSTKLTLKLLIDTKREKVLFAEASKEVIDFLFSLLCLPLSTVIRLLNNKGVAGCIGNLYQSVEELNECYMQPDQVHKNLLLRPKLPIFSALLPPDSDGGDADHKLPTSFFRCPILSSRAPSSSIFSPSAASSTPMFGSSRAIFSSSATSSQFGGSSRAIFSSSATSSQFGGSSSATFGGSSGTSPSTFSSTGPSIFSSCTASIPSMFGSSGSIPHTHNYVTRDRNTRCPNCSSTMNVEMHYVGDRVSQDHKFPTHKNGFVKDVVTYMVMDDLVIQPMSTISGITLLNKFNVKEVGDLQEKVVEFGMTQGVNLLKASLQSKNVLTGVFLDNNGAS